MGDVLYLNGEFTDLDRGRVSVLDRGFLFGDAIYEVVRVYGNRPFRLRDHMERLLLSAAGLELALPLSVAAFEEVCREILRRRPLPDGLLYLQVTRGAGPERSHAFGPELKPTVVVYGTGLVPITAEKRANGIATITVPDERWNLCHLKTTCLLMNTLSKMKALRAGVQDALYVRPDGTVTEGTATNAFAAWGGTLRTHPADNRILHGISRAIVLDLAKTLGIPVREERFTIDALLRGDEVFFTGTTTEVLPVVSVDGRPIGTGKPGPLAQKLVTAYTELWRKECVDQKRAQEQG